MAKFADLLPDPAVQKEYEKALGRFLIAFNRIERAVRDTVECLLERGHQPGLWKVLSGDPMQRQIQNMRLAALNEPDFPILPFEKIKTLATRRNEFAHGHYWSGPRKETRFNLRLKNGNKAMTLEEMNAQILEAEQLADDIEQALWAVQFP